ncbi:MAG: PKD domain-containing protein, partial [Pedobacter sp.]
MYFCRLRPDYRVMAFRHYIPTLLIFLTGFGFLMNPVPAFGQCATTITNFPYQHGFEGDNGSWVPGGTASDWAWGIPAKPTINRAAGGSRCWMIGGLTNSFYNVSQQSWLKSPCFEFTDIDHPYIEFKVFWESERRWDWSRLQYSTDNGLNWQTVGTSNDPVNCLNQNWYNFTDNKWTGNIRATNGSCLGGGGSNGWVSARHTIPTLANVGSVIFRFYFEAGSTCNNFDGFAIDDIYIGEAPANEAGFTFNCVNSRDVSFNNTSALCPTSYSWNFGDPASGAGNNASTAVNPSHSFSGPGEYAVSLTASGPSNASSTVTHKVIILDAVIS